MTQLQRRNLGCPKCSNSFSIVYYASINTWMNPKKAEEFLEGKGFVFICPECGQRIRLVTTIIISGRKGMFNISTDASIEERRRLFLEWDIIEEDGKIKDTLFR